MTKASKGIGVDETRFACCVADVSPYKGAAANAILELAESCDAPGQIATEIALVVEVFAKEGISLHGLLLDRYGAELEPEATLEACREVMRQVQQAYSERGGGGAAHVAALVDAARADVEALANLSSDDALILLVRKSEELRPGAGLLGTAIAEALNELGVQRQGGKQWDQKYVNSHYLFLQSNQRPLTEVEKRRIVVLEEKFRNTRGKWRKIALGPGNGRTAADQHKVKCYWHDTGQFREMVECDNCGKKRLLPKGHEAYLLMVEELTCADMQRKCSEPGDDVLPETVEEAPAAAAPVTHTIN